MIGFSATLDRQDEYPIDDIFPIRVKKCDVQGLVEDVK
jgi:hypothetical protein